MEKKNKPLGVFCPSAGHIHVSHATSEIEQRSRYSAHEANAIVKWMVDNIRYIEKMYAIMNPITGRYEIDLKSTIVIITPFQAQKSVIRYALDLAARNYGLHELTQIPCITIYELLTMGRRNNIIIFSTVYGSEDDWAFIRGGKDVLDVAFNWAKDYFFVFGERNVSMGMRESSVSMQEFFSKTVGLIDDDLENEAIARMKKTNDKQQALKDKEIGSFLTEHLRKMGIKVVTDKEESQRTLKQAESMSKEELEAAPDGDFEVF